VIEYAGRRLSQIQAGKLKQGEEEYVIAGSSGQLIDGSVGGSGAELINHSCDPNLTWWSRKGRIFFFSQRRIEAGEELTIYYGYPTKAHHLPCHCGERGCCKTLRYIVGLDRGQVAAVRDGLRVKSLKTRRIAARFTPYALGVGPSGIQGGGVYALEDLPAGKRIIEYAGRKLTRMQAARLEFPKDMYLAHNGRGYLVDGRISGNGSQFVNHSCVPKLKFVRSGGRIFYETLRKIQAGEELTVRYGYPTKLRRLACRCGARNCRGTLRVVVERA
jgi:SET domain-containing protein